MNGEKYSSHHDSDDPCNCVYGESKVIPEYGHKMMVKRATVTTLVTFSLEHLNPLWKQRLVSEPNSITRLSSIIKSPLTGPCRACLSQVEFLIVRIHSF